MDLSELNEVFVQKCLLNPDKVTLVGVSGGPDSQMLIYLFYRLGFRAIVCHFDHQLRPESHNEAKKVEKLANELGFKFVLGQKDINHYAETHKLSIEEAARNSRYDFLFNIARKNKAQAVAVAHNADDQVETLLMHLLRGSGLSGLKGMVYRSQPSEWDDQIPLVRPILGVWREDVLNFCSENKLQPVFDESNNDNTFYRNRLRNELIPYLKQYNPKIKERLWRTADILSQDYLVLKNEIDDVWEKCFIRSGAGYVILDIKCIKELATGLQRSVVRKAISILRPGLRNIDYDSIERALQFINNPSRTKMMDLISGVLIKSEEDRIFFQNDDVTILDDEWPRMEEKITLSLNMSGEVMLMNQWAMICDEQNTMPEDIGNLDAYEVMLDVSQLKFPLLVRTRRPGDRFQPLGMEGKSQKLSDFMINNRMPKRARDHWPLLLSGDKIIWVPGFRPAEFCKVTPETKKTVHIRLFKK